MSLLVLNGDTRKVMECLGSIGTFHVGPLSAEEGNLLHAADRHGDLSRISSLARRIDSLKKSLGAEPPPEDIRPLFPSLDALEKGLEALEKTDSLLEERRQNIRKREEDLLSSLSRIGPFLPISSPLEEVLEPSFLHFAIGQIPERKLKDLQERTKERVLILPYRTDPKGPQRVIAMTTKRGRWALETALKAHGFTPEDAGANQGSAPDIAARLGRELEENRKEEGILKREREAFQRESSSLLFCYERRIQTEERILRVEQNFGQSGYITLIKGWVPEAQVDPLCNKILETTGERAVIRIEPPPLDKEARREVPVLFRNPAWLRPFERLVKGFGNPEYDEIEPTLFVALSFLLMFGMMFGDTGHGAVLFIVGLLLNRRSRNQLLKDFGAIYAWAGGSSVLFGFLYGSTFGKIGVPQSLWMEPAQHISYFLPFAVGLGVFILSLGVIFNILNSFWRRDMHSGLFHRYGVTGFFLYWGGLGLGIKAVLMKEEVSFLEIGLFILLPLSLLFLHEPFSVLLSPGKGGGSGRLFSAFIHSLIEVIETLSAFLANTMSFVRVGAFALAHSLLCIAIFNVSEILEGFPGGRALSLLAIVLGNIIVILLEGMVVTIQVIRLEYYEFFSRFFKGEGKAFRPFRLMENG